MSSPKLSTVFAGTIFDGSTQDRPLIKNVVGELFIARVRAMPVRHLGEVFKRCTDEASLIEFTTSVASVDSAGTITEWIPASADWVDALSDDSHVLLYDSAQELNFSRAASWGERQIAAKKAQAPVLAMADRELSPHVQQMIASLLSSLPRSASQASASTQS
jgi:hypothetical protein